MEIELDDEDWKQLKEGKEFEWYPIGEQKITLKYVKKRWEETCIIHSDVPHY